MRSAVFIAGTVKIGLLLYGNRGKATRRPSMLQSIGGLF